MKCGARWERVSHCGKTVKVESGDSGEDGVPSKGGGSSMPSPWGTLGEGVRPLREAREYAYLCTA
eukprot:8702059-Pyramimonas_sp.AAC.1